MATADGKALQPHLLSHPSSKLTQHGTLRVHRINKGSPKACYCAIHQHTQPRLHTQQLHGCTPRKEIDKMQLLSSCMLIFHSIHQGHQLSLLFLSTNGVLSIWKYLKYLQSDLSVLMNLVYALTQFHS